MKVFLTGDRTMDPLFAVLAANEVLKELGAVYPQVVAQDVVTGDLAGFEAAVRYLLPTARIVPSQRRIEDGKVDLDDRHGEALKDADVCWLVHPDPLDSRIYGSAVKFWDDDALRVISY